MKQIRCICIVNHTLMRALLLFVNLNLKQGILEHAVFSATVLQNLDDICYDVKYALRVCSECKHKRACVHVYSLMGLYEEAVDMALEVEYRHFAFFTMN